MELTKQFYLAGVLDAKGHIYRDRIVVNSTSHGVLDMLQDAYGGWVDGNRWTIKVARSRLRLLADWMEGTQFRPLEVLEEYERLFAALGPEPEAPGG